jgi:hypothetical protein
LPPELSERDLDLLRIVADTRQDIHACIRDDFDTPGIMRALERVVTATNTYMRDDDDSPGTAEIQPQVLNSAVRVVREVLGHVGIGPNPGCFAAHVQGYDAGAARSESAAIAGDGDTSMPSTKAELADLLVSFRHKVWCRVNRHIVWL